MQKLILFISGKQGDLKYLKNLSAQINSGKN